METSFRALRWRSSQDGTYSPKMTRLSGTKEYSALWETPLVCLRKMRTHNRKLHVSKIGQTPFNTDDTFRRWSEEPSNERARAERDANADNQGISKLCVWEIKHTDRKFEFLVLFYYFMQSLQSTIQYESRYLVSGRVEKIKSEERCHS